MRSAMRAGIVAVRSLGAAAGVSRLVAEAKSIGVSLRAVDIGLEQAAESFRRADRIAKNFTEHWSRSGGAKAPSVAAAATKSHLEQIAVTESAESFSSGRAKYIREQPRLGLLRVWDSQLDRRACPVCSAADGTIVGANEPFPIGEPGAVHPWCRCSWTLLTPNEAEGVTTYEARKPSAQVPETVAPARIAKPAPVAHPGYIVDNLRDPKKAIAYERMLESRAVPHAVRDARRTKQFRRIVDGDLRFSEFDSFRLPLRESSFEAIERAYATGADPTGLATGRIIPEGSRSPLPVIRLGAYPDGTVNVIDGRHRLKKAQEYGARSIRAQIFFYDDQLDEVWVGVRNIPIPQ